MIVFRAPKRVVNPAALRNETCSLSFLIQLGEIEATLVEKTNPDTERLGDSSVLAARAVLTQSSPPEIDLPPDLLEVSIPEGYAYYALDPMTYVDSAEKFYADCHPAEVVCIGIRSIGTSLSALVTAALERRGVKVTRYTVRPTGDPFERTLELAPGLEADWRARPSAWFVVVDEGPGLSGSTFASVAARLADLGIPHNRVVLFPSWLPDGNGFVSQRAREVWQRHAKYSSEPVTDPDWVPFVSPVQASHPQHQARKYTLGSHLLKFEGLGPYGQARLERAVRLHQAGFSPRVLGLEKGYMRSEYNPGTPVIPEHRDPQLFETMARYLAFRFREFRTSHGTPVDELCSMIETNCGTRPWVRFEPAVPTVVDGRMLPHEWIATDSGYMKLDAIDHGDNHFYPGPTDIAWDLAAAITEFKLDSSESAALIDSYIGHSDDKRVRERLPFYKMAYSAFRHGYRSMYGC